MQYYTTFFCRTQCPVEKIPIVSKNLQIFYIFVQTFGGICFIMVKYTK